MQKEKIMYRPIVAILLGDGAGVGPEIVADLIGRRFFDTLCRPVIIGDKRILDRALGYKGVNASVKVIDSIEEASWNEGEDYPMLDRKNLDPKDAPLGELTVECGKANLDMLTYAVELYKEKKIEGFCFGPLNKAGMKKAGCPFESEHHLLAHEFNHTAPFGEINVCGEL